MNTFQRFFTTGLLTSLAFFYASTALADQMYQQQQQPYPQQQYQQSYQQQQPRERTYSEKITNKAINGFINIPTSPLEVPKSIIKYVNGSDNNIVLGVIGGLTEGILQSVYRGTTGMIDLATCLIPTKPVTSPQYVWDDFYDTNTTYGNTFRLDMDEQQPIYQQPK